MTTIQTIERLPRLLAIDDSELIHKILRVRLQHEQLELHSALNGAEGIRLAKELKPEVILLDIELGDMEGFAVLQGLKADEATRDIAVVFISAFSEPIDRVRGLDLGAVDFITKPFEMIELIARVRSILRLQNAMHMLAVKAQIDGLTGLWNRKYFDARLESEFSESLRHGKPLALVMADIDKFKSLNDGYGHPFGDLVLERFGKILSSGRVSDVACRCGGEEFGIILPSGTLDEAFEVAERLHPQDRLATGSGHHARFGEAVVPRQRCDLLDGLLQLLPFALHAGGRRIFDRHRGRAARWLRRARLG